MIIEKEKSNSISPNNIIEIRGKKVLLDSHVAKAFGTETKRVNEAVKRNPEKFTKKHCFQLTVDEHKNLRSQIATSKGNWGGNRYLPNVFTLKGVARLATVLGTYAALRATDMIIDTFITVYEQVTKGQTQIAISNPSKFLVSNESQKANQKFRIKLFNALNNLLDTVVFSESKETLRDITQKIGSHVMNNVQERIKTQGLKNNKLEADTSLILAQAEELLAKARRIDSETALSDIAVIKGKIEIVKELIKMSKEIEPAEFIQLLDSFDKGTALKIEEK